MSLATLVIIILAVVALGLRIDPSFSSLIAKGGEYNTNARILTAAYGENNALQIIIQVDDSSTLSNRPATQRDTDLTSTEEALRSLLSESQYVTRISPLEYSRDDCVARLLVSVYEPQRTDGLVLVERELSHAAAADKIIIPAPHQINCLCAPK